MCMSKQKDDLVMLTIRIEKSLLNRLKKLGDRLGIYSYSGTIRYILHKHLQEEKV